jgi:16S rRNA (cytosine967-C5)-methyltransferase
LKPQRLEDLLTLALCLLSDEQEQKYPPFTVTDQAVAAAACDPELMRGKGLINACLRRFLREQADLMKKIAPNISAQWNFPLWWIEKVRLQYPDTWQRILNQANTRPPMVLRVNRQKISQRDYLGHLELAGIPAQAMGEYAVLLKTPMPVADLPGFADGLVSIQDIGAQLAAPLLGLREGMRVLDACAAPGGKTGHILELASVEVLAIDFDPKRLERVDSNLRRLQLATDAVELKAADAADTKSWWDGKPFDAILADLPCSGSGVVRRHPDIRHLRRPTDVVKLSHTQEKILRALWSVLKPGGTLVLVTCSIFSEEGQALAKNFAHTHPEAQLMPSPGGVSPQSDISWQEPDGFFYAVFSKGISG